MNKEAEKPLEHHLRTILIKIKETKDEVENLYYTNDISSYEHYIKAIELLKETQTLLSTDFPQKENKFQYIEFDKDGRVSRIDAEKPLDNDEQELRDFCNDKVLQHAEKMAKASRIELQAKDAEIKRLKAENKIYTTVLAEADGQEEVWQIQKRIINKLNKLKNEK